MKVVIIGSSAAGLYAAENLRKISKDVDITMVSKDSEFPYYRPLLSHMIGEEELPKRFFLKEKEFFSGKNINLILNREVTGINRSQQFISLDNGSELSYDKLILCNGSYNFIPPVKGSDKTGVFSIKYLEDIRKINQYLDRVSHAVVIGGGLLGIEAAWALKEKGKQVSIVEFAQRLMPRQLDEEASAMVEDRVREDGMNLYLAESAEEILGEKAVSGIRLKSGKEIKTELVIFSVGIRPDIRLAQEAGLKVDKGVITDPYLRTSDPNIYAAGDVAEVEGMLQGIWPAAMQMGKLAAANLMGGNEPFRSFTPATSLKALSTGVYSIGTIDGGEGIEEKVFREGENYKKLLFKDGALVGGILIGDTKLSGFIQNKEKWEKIELSL